MIHKAEWMKILPIQPEKLTLSELRNFKAAHKLLVGDELKGPVGWQEYLRCFRFFQFFSIASIVENKFPALTKCWYDLNKTFMEDPIFDDGIFIESWIFFDFPLDTEGRTLLDEFELFLKEGDQLPAFADFLKEMKKSRLGLYQETMSTPSVTKFRELFTGRVLSTIRSVPEYGKGEIFLTRVVEHNGELFQFGDPKCWPKNHKSQIEDMILNKLFYFEGQNTNERYEKYMKLAGPYWFSCVSTDPSVDIYSPDHYLKYLT